VRERRRELSHDAQQEGERQDAEQRGAHGLQPASATSAASSLR
jgi:hypothetical protein